MQTSVNVSNQSPAVESEIPSTAAMSISEGLGRVQTRQRSRTKAAARGLKFTQEAEPSAEADGNEDDADEQPHEEATPAKVLPSMSHFIFFLMFANIVLSRSGGPGKPCLERNDARRNKLIQTWDCHDNYALYTMHLTLVLAVVDRRPSRGRTRPPSRQTPLPHSPAPAPRPGWRGW